MPALINAERVKQELFEILDLDASRRPAGLTDPVIDRYIREETSLILGKLGLSTLPASNTSTREGAEGVCLDLVLVRLRRAFFGLDGTVMQALNTQYEQTLRKLENLVEAVESGGDSDFEVWGSTE